MADPSNAGPFTIGPSGQLPAGGSDSLRFAEVSAGPANKEGYLRKLFGARGGMDYVFIVNASAELITAETKSGSTAVPPATSQTLDAGPYRAVTVNNEGANPINTGADDRVAVEVGNGTRNPGEGSDTWSARDALDDVIPGLNLGGI